MIPSWTRSVKAAGAGLVVLAVFSASPAFGIPPTLRVVVNTDNDGPGSLRQTIKDADASNTNDTIMFDSTARGTIMLSSGNLEIEHSLSIIGPGASTLAISGEGNFQVFIVDLGATVSISGLTVEQGKSPMTAPGGGIVNAGTLTVTNSTLSGNSAPLGDGGAISNEQSGTLTLTNSTVSANFAQSVGGGIANEGGTLTLTNSTISTNLAEVDGGGIANSGTLTLTNSTVSANVAQRGGGGIESFGTLTVTNSTLSGNSAHTGGAIDNAGTLTVTNSTLSGNSASLAGFGSIYNEMGSATLKNTIVANSILGGNCASVATFTSDGHNLSDDTSCDSLFIATGDVNNTPAGLDSGGLKNNGGPTQTIALLATSPAVDAVPVSPTNFCTAADGTTPIATDQRGVTRPDPEDGPGGHCDIGAFELVQAATPTPTATATSTPTATPTATATPSAGRISASTNPITLKGKPGHPKSKKLKVKNIGTGPLDVTGTAGLSAPLSSSGGGVLAPKKSLAITVTDSPTTGGSTVSETLKILSNDPTKREVDITVTGTSP